MRSTAGTRAIFSHWYGRHYMHEISIGASTTPVFIVGAMAAVTAIEFERAVAHDSRVARRDATMARLYYFLGSITNGLRTPAS